MSIISASTATTSRQAVSTTRVIEVFEQPETISKSLTVKIEDYQSFIGLATAKGEFKTGKHDLVDEERGRLLSFSLSVGSSCSGSLTKGVLSFRIDEADVVGNGWETLL